MRAVPHSKALFVCGVLALGGLTSLSLCAAFWSRGPGPHAETALGWGVVWLTSLVVVTGSLPFLLRLHRASRAIEPPPVRAALVLPLGLLLGIVGTALSAALWSLLDRAF